MTDNGSCYKSFAFRRLCNWPASDYPHQVVHPENQREGRALHPPACASGPTWRPTNTHSTLRRYNWSDLIPVPVLGYLSRLKREQCLEGELCSMPDISLIVCTRNRAKSLRMCLNSIEQAAAANRAIQAELIVVNNASTDSTVTLLQDWQQSTSVPCKVVVAEQSGLSNARNCGLEHATGTTVAFTDDDCTLAPDYFVQLERAYAHDVMPVVRGGRVELGDPRDLPFTIKTDLALQRFAGGHPGGFIHGCNLTMSRSVLERVNRFDIRLGAGQAIGAAEDSDFVYRAYRAGVTVLYDPSIVVFHHHGRRDPTEVKRLQALYDLGNGALYAKHGFKDWRLLLRILRDIRRGLWEFFGGPLADEEFGISHRDNLRGNLKGAMRFWFGAGN